MWYLGSKGKISKYIVPIIQKYIDDNNIKLYLEPFVGGANVIDKIKCETRIGTDIHKQLIELLKKAQDKDFEFPAYITKTDYDFASKYRKELEDWYIGFVGFCGSFGAKYFGGYRRDSKDDDSPIGTEKCIKGFNKQRPLLEGIKFAQSDFRNLKKDNIKNFVIYCDIPYRGTTKYKTEDFPYEDFYNWCRELSKDNIILISEYNMPEDFVCIWEKEHKTLIDSNRTSNDENMKRMERLYTI